MWLAKFKRSFSKKIPYLILSLFFIFGAGALVFFASQYALSKQGTFISPLSQNKTIQGNDLKGLLNRNNIPFSEIKNATDSSYIVFLKDQGEVDLSSDKNLAPQISSLQLILSRLTIEGKKFKRLDLRFNKPIIEF